MHPLLRKVLEKAGIKGPEDLKPEEKADFDRWRGILSEGEVTVERVQEFCRTQIDLIEKKWRDPSCPNRERLIDQHVVYRSILDATTAPQVEKENLEKYLNSLLTKS